MWNVASVCCFHLCSLLSVCSSFLFIKSSDYPKSLNYLLQIFKYSGKILFCLFLSCLMLFVNMCAECLQALNEIWIHGSHPDLVLILLTNAPFTLIHGEVLSVKVLKTRVTLAEWRPWRLLKRTCDNSRLKLTELVELNWGQNSEESGSPELFHCRILTPAWAWARWRWLNPGGCSIYSAQLGWNPAQPGMMRGKQGAKVMSPPTTHHKTRYWQELKSC